MPWRTVAAGAGVAVGGVQDELEDRADAAGGELLLVFLDADAALVRRWRRR